ncbi:GTPase IMAP family member 7-like [Triplophysa rosa]|uniref:GTPase IMAP family member 7-like n=1 Tax=Triplophysa rosa TaxID=992332 RepID=A0A9W7TQS2_TRIRA|nr:GTPase IMAP family member 7-like [Triplophysa rosa]XP_057206298.1 GTPase IMAP family member 7-like [Triplophysa rosa]KAI7800723.1 putative GTPase IMAP family member 7-like [Triplophysa rosa]
MGCTSSVSVPERRIVLLGKSGDGKSSAGNTILRENIFTTKASASNARVDYQRGERKVYGKKITVIDTPGVFDADRDEETTKSEIVKSLIECAPAVDAVIIVLKVGRYTKHENEVVQNLLNTLKDKRVLKHTVILLTHGEQLEGKAIEEFMKGCSELQVLVAKCGGRCHVIDNKYWNKHKRGEKSNRVQVKKLLETIEELVKENGCYTNQLLQKVEEQIQEEVKNMTEDNVHPGVQQEKAKKIVHNKIMKGLLGGVAGALCSISVLIPSLLSFLNLYSSLNATLAAAGLGATGLAAGVFGVVGVVGGVLGAFTGWRVTQESESGTDAIANASMNA